MLFFLLSRKLKFYIDSTKRASWSRSLLVLRAGFSTEGHTPYPGNAYLHDSAVEKVGRVPRYMANGDQDLKSAIP